jgi:hypothetical protein
MVSSASVRASSSRTGRPSGVRAAKRRAASRPAARRGAIGSSGLNQSFACRRPLPGGGWAWNLAGVERVLYRLPETLAAIAGGATVFVVEGEKDADRLALLGLAAHHQRRRRRQVAVFLQCRPARRAGRHRARS